MFGFSVSPSDLDLPVRSFYNSDLSTTAGLLSHFDWAVYGFNSGHFVHTIRDPGLPFRIVLAAAPFSNGRALLQELTMCPTILSGAPALLDHICGLGLTSKLTGYLIHLHRYQGSEPTRMFWDLQAHIVTQFRLIRSLSIFAAFVHPDHDGRAVLVGFVVKLRKDGWIISDTNISYAAYGDSVAGTCRLIVGVHSNTERDCTSLEFKMPPTHLSWRLGHYLWAPFNRPEMAVSYSMNDASFNKTTPSMTPAFHPYPLRFRRIHSLPPYLLASKFCILFTGPTIHFLLSARVSSVWMAYAHLLSPTKLPICSDTITGSNSFMTVTLMFDPSPLSNLSLAINLAMK